MADDEDIDEFIDDFGRLALAGHQYPAQFGDEPLEDEYFVHIDVLQNSSQLVAQRINSHMIGHNCFDPRKGFQFPLDLHTAGQNDTMQIRRINCGIGKEYYELWKVKRNFSVLAFRTMVETLAEGVRVRLVRMVGGDHQIFVFNGANNAHVRVPITDH